MMRDQSALFSRPASAAATAARLAIQQSSPQGQLLWGRYIGPLRSAKGKIKGLMLHHADGELAIKLPKYLRPLLVRDLAPGAWVQVWAYREDDRWQGTNLIPWPEAEVSQALKDNLAQPSTAAGGKPVTLSPSLARPQDAPPAKAAKSSTKKSSTKKACIQVCRKGKCLKQGGQQILQTLKAEVEANPDLQHISVEGTGCMGACKQGPNLRVMPQKKMHSRVTPDRALRLLARRP